MYCRLRAGKLGCGEEQETLDAQKNIEKGGRTHDRGKTIFFQTKLDGEKARMIVVVRRLGNSLNATFNFNPIA